MRCCWSRWAIPLPRSARPPPGPARPPTATAARACGSPDHLAREPGEVWLEPPLDRQRQELRHLIWMPLPHGGAQRLPPRRIRLQQDHHFGLLRHLSLPAVNRAGAREERPTSYQAGCDEGCDERPRVGVVRGAREHNLKDITVEIPRDSLTVITGLSGSGKSSLAFDTIYAEGQRRYVESLSAYARQFLGLMEKPDVDAIEGLSPAISIEQKTAGHNPRSTVGTVTEVYDYLRLLWARLGTPHCPKDGSPIERQSASQITDLVLAWPEGTKLEVLAPLVRGRKGEFRDVFEAAKKQGFVRVRVDGETYDLAQVPKLNRRQNHDIAVVVDRLVVRRADRPRLADSIETALKAADGTVEVVRGAKSTLFSERYACPVCGLSLPEFEPRQFSFNSPFELG